MKQKHFKLKLNRYTICVSILLVVASAFVVYKIMHNRAETAAAKPPVGAAVKSMFSFTGATGWWQGATNETSMAVFHKYDCFTSVEYKTGTVDIDAELEKVQNSVASGDYTVIPGSTQTLMLQTKLGPQKYELHQSSVVIPQGAMPVKAGQEFGYLQLSDGYIKIMGYCDTPDQLPATIPALQAIKFQTAQ